MAPWALTPLPPLFWLIMNDSPAVLRELEKPDGKQEVIVPCRGTVRLELYKSGQSVCGSGHHSIN